MAESTYSLVKRVASQLKYQELPHLIGRQVTIHSVESSTWDILGTLEDAVPSQCELYRPEQKYLHMALAKYDLMDLVFLVPDDLWGDNVESGFQLLKKLGFIPKREEREEAVEFAQLLGEDSKGPMCIDELDIDLKMQKTFLRLFLRGEHEHKMSREKNIQFILPEDYFPKELEITDACLTNAGGIWLWKNFYL